MFLEFNGTESSLEEQASTVAEISKANGGSELEWSIRPEERSRLWTARHNCYYANIALRPGSRSVTTDCCVPISALPTIITQTKQDIINHGLTGPIVGHVGDGNFHSMLLFDPEDPEEFKTCKKVADRMARLAIELGGEIFPDKPKFDLLFSGTCTGEHGIGLGKIELLEYQFGTAGLQAMKQIKLALDPLGLMNPGKLFTI